MAPRRCRSHSVRARLALGIACASLALLARVGEARAHEAFEITTEAKVFPDRLQLFVAMASRTAAKLCPGLAQSPDDLSESDLDRARDAFQACARGLYRVESAGERLEPREVRVGVSVEHDFETMLIYPPPSPGALRLDAVHLARLPDPTYGALVTAVAERVFLGQVLLRADASVMELILPARGTPPAAPSTPASPSPLRDFFRLGVVHILTGYDHLLFLVGVLLGCPTLRAAFALVTAFTLGHSLSLLVATLNVVSLPSLWVEPAIAATLTFVGIEALRKPTPSRARLPITLAFGVIHGFGFAGALREHGVGVRDVPIAAPLVAFNLGVELGQVLIGAPLVLALLWVSRRERAGTRTRHVLAGLVSLAGLYWLVERTLLAT